MKKHTYFVTGGTGFLGSHIVKHLLEKDYTVLCLVRGAGEKEAEERLINVLRKIPSAGPLHTDNLQVVCGNITKPGLGIEDTGRLRDTRYFIHSAADVKFNSRNPASTFRINHDGAMESIRLARSLSIPFFFHISTAYVSGKREGLIMETLDKGRRDFNNDYEKSKAMAEISLARYAEAHDMNLSIIRPGIIVGDSVYGYVPKLNTIYNFLTPLVRIRNAVDRGRLRGGHIRASKGGTINVPVMLPAHEETKLNLITVDFAVRTFSNIMDRESRGVRIYHALDNNPPDMTEVIAHVSDILNIRGIDLVTPEYYARAKKGGLNAALAGLNRTYMCYTTSAALYDTSNLSAVLRGGFPSADKKSLISLMIECTKQKLAGSIVRQPADDYSDIHGYFEVFLREKRGRRLIKNLDSFTTCFEIAFSDIPDKHWSMKIDRGLLVSVSDNGHNGKPDCTYIVTSRAFRDITGGRMSPQESFFKGDIDIQGNMKLGLKLASLMEIFFREHPYKTGEQKTVGARKI